MKLFRSAASVVVAVVAVVLLAEPAAGNHRVRRIVGGRAAAPPPTDDPVVFVYKKDHDARVFGTRERPGGFYVYRGIRYAEPPVGLYRFQMVQDKSLWSSLNVLVEPSTSSSGTVRETSDSILDSDSAPVDESSIEILHDGTAVELLHLYDCTVSETLLESQLDTSLIEPLTSLEEICDTFDDDNYGGTLPTIEEFTEDPFDVTPTPEEQNVFSRPRPMRLEGIVNATLAGAPCIQPHPDDPLKTIGSEDCLYLNIYSAQLPDGESEGLPVLVWIHGGGFRRGSANQYGTGHLVDKKVVVVTVQYRLGSLGYMSTSSQQLPGNVAMFDMAAAMNWIKEYISFFGGNPNNVVTMGQGTGASSAMMMGLSPMTQDNVKGIVAMSGSALSPNAVDEKPMDATDELAVQLGCPLKPHLAMVRCMQEAPADEIVFADETLQTFRLASQGFVGGLGGMLTPSPVVEGKEDSRFLPSFLPEQPAETLENGNFPNISLLTGVCKDETGRAVKGGFNRELQSKLQSVPDFLNKVLLKDLASHASSVINNVQNLFGGLAASPLFQQAEKAVGPITKVVEATTDALFNLPMFRASQLWSKNGGKAFVYSFEHTSPRAAEAGRSFLGGLPLMQAALDAPAALNETFHGDDLAFVFDARPLEGQKDAARGQVSLSDPEDMKVRDIFTGLIADFAHSGQAMVRAKGDKKQGLSLPGFGSGGGEGGKKENNFLVIDKNPRIGKDFRGCQMAVWSGLTGPQLPADSCADIFKNVAGALGGLAGGVGNTAGALTGGLLGGGGGSAGKAGGQRKPPNPIGGLFGRR